MLQFVNSTALRGLDTLLAHSVYYLDSSRLCVCRLYCNIVQHTAVASIPLDISSAEAARLQLYTTTWYILLSTLLVHSTLSSHFLDGGLFAEGEAASLG